MRSRTIVVLALLAACGKGKSPAVDSGTDPEIDASATADGAVDGAVDAPGSGYRLPWKPGVGMQLTQDCGEGVNIDHTKWAYDWANGSNFQITAARGGTISHLKINSTDGCDEFMCSSKANVIVVDHGDGTHAIYLALKGDSLAENVTCGGAVTRGQALALAGATGWSTGLHLHFMVSEVHAGAPTCECGADGEGCSPDDVPWNNFWATEADPSVEIAFDEWPTAGACDERRIQMPASQNE